MKKDKKWLKEEVNKALMVYSGNPNMGSYDYGRVSGLSYALKLINQLEEPEIINSGSLKRLKESVINEPDDFCLYKDDLLGWIELLKKEEPEQEKVVVPQFVADRIEEYKEIQFGISLIYMINRQLDDDVKFSKWLSSEKDNCEKVARAWLDGYLVEEQKLYKIKISEYDYLVQNEYGTVCTMDTGLHEYKDTFTEQEIKAIDERYWSFAEEITT